ncbi:MAG: hypothetical protein NTY38_11900, partial [Acidobacteria bacterium]|nr:hypothetical protein [Acidobacteriota bacterium]
MIHVHTSRRTFLLGVAGLSGRPRRIFDSHLHCPGENGARRQGARAVSTFQEFVACLDRSGIQRGIVSSVRSLFARSPADFIAGNREVVRRVESYGDRFIGACVVNPMFIDEALREMEDCRNQFGCLWVSENAGGEGTTRYGAREFELLVKQTAKLSMALAVHTDVDGMEQVAGKFPAAAIVFAHAGERRSPMDPSR